MLEKAASGKPDLVVMPEAVAMLCYPDDRPDFTYLDVAEPIPGQTSDAACRIAREFNVNVVIGLIELRQNGGQNLCLVIDRSGTIVGRYEKVHEPEICRLEQMALVGNEIPVFDLDFGRIGIFICWDLNYPELPSILAAKGTDLLIFPHMISLSSDSNFGLRLRARAADNGLPLVAAGMRDEHNHNGTEPDLGPTCILDANGGVVSASLHPGPDVISAAIELDSDSPSRSRAKRFRKDVRPDVYSKEWKLAAGDRP